jgi:kynurenine formamidase
MSNRGSTPSEQDVLEWMDSLSNWGRWGAEDEMGALNLITPEKVNRAAGLVQEGFSVTCARPLDTNNDAEVYRPTVRLMLESGEGWSHHEKHTDMPMQLALEYISMVYHGYHITHLDSPAHFFWNGQMYNGRPSSLVSTNRGATVCSVDNARNGIIGRGVLVDVPLVRGVDWLDREDGVMPADILEAEDRCGFQIEEGDVLFIRTGQLRRTLTEGPFNPAKDGSTACNAACLPLLRERDISVLGTDTANDMLPSPYRNITNPIHQVALIRMGVWILDNANFEELAVACSERGRWEFMVNMGVLRIIGGTGSPVNPIVVFYECNSTTHTCPFIGLSN